MRIKLKKTDLETLFFLLREKGISDQKLATKLSVSSRTIRLWKSGKTTMPQAAYTLIVKIAGIREATLSPVVLSNYWHIIEAAKKGAKVRQSLYGNLGTEDGRRKGGLASWSVNQKLDNGFKKLKAITEPKKSVELAELLGILVGDGHMSEYQVTMSTNAITDRSHASHVKNLFKKLFNLPCTISHRVDKNTLIITVSSKQLVQFLHKYGMPIGDKIKNNLCIPQWVLDREVFQTAFVRGLFDTDGCIYLDKHIIRGKLYKYLGWTITSYADKLVEDLIVVLENLGFAPTYKVSQKSVFLRRQAEIQKYFREVGTSNKKHLKRFQKFSGEVPKWS